MTNIVVMVWHVVLDLRDFLFLYMLFIFIISQTYAVLGLGNNYGEAENNEKSGGEEYMKVGLHFGYFIQTLKLSMGDFEITKAVSKLSKPENILFWLVYVVNLYVSTLFFLNFIVVEAMATYKKVQNHCQQLIQ